MEKFDIYWVDIFYEDNPSKFKTRPAVVIDPEKETLLVLKLSTNLLTPVPNYELEDYKEEGLKKPSTAVLKYFVKPSPSAIRGFIGHLTKKDEEGLTELMKKFPPKNESLREENIMDEKQKEAMERLQKMYENPKFKDAIESLLFLMMELSKPEEEVEVEEKEEILPERMTEAVPAYKLGLEGRGVNLRAFQVEDPFNIEADLSFEHDDDASSIKLN